MTKKKFWSIVLLVVAGIIVVVGESSPLWLPPLNYDYSGKVLLSQQDYTSFKQDCSVKGITINSLEELNHDYPVLVQFDVTSPTETFPYGKKHTNIDGNWIPVILASIPFFIVGTELL